MRISTFSKFVLAASCLVPALPMLADSVPYKNVGKIAPTVTTVASSSNGVGIDLYYYGSSASYMDYVQVLDVTNGFESGKILANQTSTVGQSVVVGQGSIKQGDQLVFILDSPEGTFASNGKYSDDGDNHVYIAQYAGGVVNGSTLPAGLFLGFEDKKASDSDWDYNDL